MGNSTARVDPFDRTSEEVRELQAKLEAANREAAQNWDDPRWRHEMAQGMTEEIYWGFEHENLLGLFANVENAPFDGRVFVKEVRGLRAFWVARGGYIEASTIHSEVIEVPRDTIGFHVYEFEDKLITSFGETQATMVDLSIQRMDAAVNQRVLALFQASIPSTSPYYISGPGLDLTAVNLALREVRDSSGDPVVTLIGRATMTEQIVDRIMGVGSNGAGFLPETNERLLAQGVLGVYRGARIVTLKNFQDDADQPFFPANELFVVGRDAAKFAFWGGLRSKEATEDLNWYWHYLARRDFGGVVHRPYRMRRIVDTSISATQNQWSSFTTP